MKIALVKKSILWLFVAIFVAGTVGFNYGFRKPKDNEAAARFENRKITAFPSMPFRKKAFYTEFEKWYRDRMYKRQKAIFGWRKAKHAIGVIEPKDIIVGEDGWLLSKGTPKSYNGDSKKIPKLKKMQDLCDKNGAKFIVMLAPWKDPACKRYYPYVYRKNIVDYLQISNKAVASLRKNGIGYVDSCPAIMKAMEEDNPEHPLYVKDDHHWSYFGAIIAADLLLKELRDLIGIEYDDILTDGSTLQGNREHSRWTKLGLGNDPQRSIGVVPWHKKFTKNLKIINSRNKKEIKPSKPIANNYLWGPMTKGEGIIINSECKNDRTLLMLSDSYGPYMMPYLTQYFEKTVETHYNRKHYDKKPTNLKYLLEKYKPDAVVYFAASYAQMGDLPEIIVK